MFVEPLQCHWLDHAFNQGQTYSDLAHNFALDIYILYTYNVYLYIYIFIFKNQKHPKENVPIWSHPCLIHLPKQLNHLLCNATVGQPNYHIVPWSTISFRHFSKHLVCFLIVVCFWKAPWLRSTFLPWMQSSNPRRQHWLPWYLRCKNSLNDLQHNLQFGSPVLQRR